MTTPLSDEGRKEAQNVAYTGLSMWQSEFSCGAADDEAFEKNGELLGRYFDECDAQSTLLSDYRGALERIAGDHVVNESCRTRMHASCIAALVLSPTPSEEEK